MSNEIKISRPRLRVVVELDSGELAQVDVQTDNRDAVAFDLTRRAKRWPGAEEAPMLWMTVTAWAAIKRSGGIEGLAGIKDVDNFLDRCVDVTPIDEEGNPAGELDELTANPTNPATGSG